MNEDVKKTRDVFLEHFDWIEVREPFATLTLALRTQLAAELTKATMGAAPKKIEVSEYYPVSGGPR